jgi:hypothetical protein
MLGLGKDYAQKMIMNSGSRLLLLILQLELRINLKTVQILDCFLVVLRISPWVVQHAARTENSKQHV